MYSYILFFHSIWRWFVLVALMAAIFRGFKGWLRHEPFTKADDTLRHMTATAVHIQLILGLVVYSFSPLIRYFWSNYHEAVHERDIRFFGMEHSLMMLIAVIIVTIGSMLAKRRTIDRNKFKVMAIFYSIGLLVILANIPWPFSPLVSRPWFRML
ncbi:MAG: hypothetical protein JSS76_01575 [Bacteroidetes bacterium]|nr:hypothetical protein [Bacteroidota bacterium]